MLDVKNIPSAGGICMTCTERNNCPMVALLPVYRANVREYGDYYKDVMPHLWENESIDEPEYNLIGNIEWCPLYSEGEGPDEI